MRVILASFILTGLIDQRLLVTFGGLPVDQMRPFVEQIDFIRLAAFDSGSQPAKAGVHQRAAGVGQPVHHIEMMPPGINGPRTVPFL